MTDVDAAIRRALSPEDAKAYDALGREPSMVVQAMQAFQAHNRLFAVAGWVGGFALFGVALYAAWRFCQAPDVRGMLVWGGATALALAGVALIKLWFFMEMQKNNVIRELKRLELQVASLIAISGRP